MRKIFWSAIIVMEVYASGLFFHAAWANNLPKGVANCAWLLGGCCLTFAIFVAIMELYLNPKREAALIKKIETLR